MPRMRICLLFTVEPDYMGPDYFAFYTREVEELLSQGEDVFPFPSQSAELGGRNCGAGAENDITMCSKSGRDNTLSASLFGNSIGATLSDFKRERVKAVLQQSVIALSKEVDETLDTVFTIHKIQSHFICKRSQSNYSAAECETDSVHPHKKIKVSTSHSSVGTSVHGSHKDYRNEDKYADLAGKETSNGVKTSDAPCHTIENPMGRTGPKEPQSLCNACGERDKTGEEPPSIKDQNEEACLVSNRVDDNECKLSDDMQFLLENDAVKVELLMKKHSGEISTTLGHMEQQLEGLLDTILSNCRPMTLAEKQQLQKLIQKLPSRNLDRVVEIIQRSKPSREYPSDEIHVDLEREDDLTLWRLYYYVKAVEKARELSVAEI